MADASARPPCAGKAHLWGALAAALTVACFDDSSHVSRSPDGRAELSRDAPIPSRKAAHLGTWVWRKETVLGGDERQTLIDFARRRGVTDLYVAIADEYETPEGLHALADLLRGARQAHIQLTWVCGDPTWALSTHHAGALAMIDWAVRVNALLREQSLPPIFALQYDVEPYLLPEWKAAPETVEPQYLALLAKLRDATRAASFELWLDLPFWLDERSFQGTPLGKLAIRSADGIVIMAYRSTAEGIVDKATALLGEPDARARSVVVAIETSCREEPLTTLCGISPPALDRTLSEVQGRLGSFEAFAGLAVHPYEGWRALSPR